MITETFLFEYLQGCYQNIVVYLTLPEADGLSFAMIIRLNVLRKRKLCENRKSIA
jgi:hypothetical protein